jgi:glycosyltransferase involved in cell wall biosynthesis
VQKPKISIIIPARNEERYVAACLESILHSDYPKERTEVLVIDGMSSDRTVEIVKGYAARYPFITLLENIDKTVPYAMNIGIERARGDYIIRLDAHSAYPPDYFTRLIKWSKKLQADNIGGIWVTDVLNKNPKSDSIKTVLSDRLGVGGALFRVGVDEVTEVDTVPFGCYKKEVFEKYGLYDERLTRNQDIELNKRIKKGGGKIYLVPEINCTYFARETLSQLAKNNFANGMWNILTAYYTGTFSSLSLRHYIPLLFVLSLMVPPLLSVGIPGAYLVSVLSLCVYLLAIFSRSAMLKNASNRFVYLAAAFIVLHLSYGIGSLIGIIKILNRSSKDKNESVGH